MHELRGQNKKEEERRKTAYKTDTVHLVQGLISSSLFPFFFVVVNWFSCVSAQSETINAFVTISYGHFAWDCSFVSFLFFCEYRQSISSLHLELFFFVCMVSVWRVRACSVNVISGCG